MSAAVRVIGSYQTGELAGREREWFGPNRLADPAGSNALSANSHRLDLAAWQRSLDVLEVRQKSTTGDTRNLCTNATQVLRLTTGLDHIANLGRLSANFTSSCHD